MNHSLHVVADAHIWGVESAFSTLPGFDVTLRVLEHRDICREALKDTDALVTRSSTQVNAHLLKGTSVRFAATATIGDDHFDKVWLASHHIAFANAAGSSTRSVLEYMITALLDLHVRGLISIPDTSIGIIGAGRIGGALAKRCTALGMRVLLNDPPRARQECGDQEGRSKFCSLDTILEQADIISMHTPLIREGEYCTVHLLSESQLAAFKGKGVINTGRGACLDNAALWHWLERGQDCHFAVLDCWEHEPKPATRLIQHPGMAIATPHIAGHSIEGKAANTQFIYNALCRFLNIKPAWDMHDELPGFPACVTCPVLDDPWQTLHAAATTQYPISHDDKVMRSWADLPVDALAKAFIDYRRHYPARRAWQHAPVSIPSADVATLKMAQAMGLKVI